MSKRRIPWWERARERASANKIANLAEARQSLQHNTQNQPPPQHQPIELPPPEPPPPHPELENPVPSTSGMQPLQPTTSNENIDEPEDEEPPDKENIDNRFSKTPTLPGKTPFDKPKVVFSDDNVDVLVHRIGFARQKRHILHDHHYSLTIRVHKANKSKKLVIESVLAGMFAGLRYVLKTLQEFYEGEANRYVFIALTHNAIQNGVR